MNPLHIKPIDDMDRSKLRKMIRGHSSERSSDADADN